MTGIEPALSAWEADVLPLNYIRRSGQEPQRVTCAVPATTSYRNSRLDWGTPRRSAGVRGGGRSGGRAVKQSAGALAGGAEGPGLRPGNKGLPGTGGVADDRPGGVDRVADYHGSAGRGDLDALAVVHTAARPAPATAAEAHTDRHVNHPIRDTARKPQGNRQDPELGDPSGVGYRF